MAFTRLIKNAARQHNAAAICEECNHEALAERDLTTSTLEPVALQLGLIHRYCDPTREERTARGILQENAIRLRGWPSKLPPTESEVAVLLNESNIRRETYWIEQLEALNSWPAIFVCGAEHVSSLLTLMTEHGLYPVLVAADWGA
jgi:hypothetical protein